MKKNINKIYPSENSVVSVLIITYNELNLLKKEVDSIIRHTNNKIDLYVIDGGSDDGTIEYIVDHPLIIPVLQKKLVGGVRAYNPVMKKLKTKYICWLSGDTELTPNILDTVINILDNDSQIGLVGLKMKDTIGPWANDDYLGAVSMYGILNCNHGVIRSDILKSIGFLDEKYIGYMFDPDLTTMVLCCGSKVVMTKKVGVLHHREWSVDEEREKVAVINRKEMMAQGIEVYKDKYFLFNKFLNTRPYRIKYFIWIYLKRIISKINYKYIVLFLLGSNKRDIRNIFTARFINIFDKIICLYKPYHLVQSIPIKYLNKYYNKYL